MTYPWMMTLVAQQHEQDLLEGARRRQMARAARDSARRGPRWRERLGWRLVDLGIHLVMHPDPRIPPGRTEARVRSVFEAAT